MATGAGRISPAAGNVSIANNITLTGGTSNVLGLSIGGTGVLDYSGVVTAYNGRMDLKDTVTLNLAAGSSINLTGTNGNQVLFANTGTTLNMNGGSFTSTGNNGSQCRGDPQPFDELRDALHGRRAVEPGVPSGGRHRRPQWRHRLRAGVFRRGLQHGALQRGRRCAPSLPTRIFCRR